MATNRGTATSHGSTAWAGWVVFAGSLLLMIGTFNIIEGFVALLDDERVLVTPNQLILFDLTGWGWSLLIFGTLMVLTGLGLFAAQTWARVTAIIIVGLHAVLQMLTLGAYPVWSLLMMALDIVVLYALTAKWQAASRELDL